MNLSARLQWIFAVLVLLCGMPLLFLDKEGPNAAHGYLLAGMATLFLGAFGLCLAWNSLETGEIKIQHFRYNRSSQPRRFMATVALILISACGTLITAVWFLFFK